MSSAPLFKGIIPPVTTIFNEIGQLDKTGMKKHIDFLIDKGVNGLFFLGTTGEFSQMDVRQREEVTAFATEYVNGRVPVLIGTGSSSTTEVIRLSQHAKKCGANGVAVVNPYYWSLSEERLYRHYADIAETVDLPILLYNIPMFTGQDLSPDFVQKLAATYKNIVGIKETVDQAGHIREMIIKVKKIRSDFSIFSGFDDHLLNTLSLGGDGAISGSANFAPEIGLSLCKAFEEGNLEKAIQLQNKLALLTFMYKLDSPFVNVIKEAVRLRGIPISTYVLPPARSLNDEKRIQLITILNEVGLL